MVRNIRGDPRDRSEEKAEKGMVRTSEEERMGVGKFGTFYVSYGERRKLSKNNLDHLSVLL